MISKTQAIGRLIESLQSARLRKSMYLYAVPAQPEDCINFLNGLRVGMSIFFGLDWPSEARRRVLEARGLRLRCRWEDDQLASRGLGPEEIVDELLAIEIEMWKGMTPDEIEPSN